MQFTWKNSTSTFKVCWNINCVTNTAGSTNVLIRKLWQRWLGYKEVVRNFVASYVNGTTEAGARHYHVKQRPAWEEAILGQKNVAHRSLVEKTKTYLPPLHMILGLIKIYVTTMNKEGKVFDYLRQKKKNSRISEVKIKEGIFVGQVQQCFPRPRFRK